MASCFGAGNEGAAVIYTGTSVAKGGSVRVDLYQMGLAVFTDEAVVHTFQLISGIPGSPDFIGWGTVRGEGTHDPDAIMNCPDDYSDGWHVFADGRQFDQYWCRQGSYGNLAAVSSNRIFKIKYQACTGDGLTRFSLFLDGVEKTCARIDSTYGILAGGGEVIGTLFTKDIDHDMEDLHVYFTAGWFLWNSSHAFCDVDAPYFIQEISNVEFNIRSGI